jgi:hypothetical protein
LRIALPVIATIGLLVCNSCGSDAGGDAGWTGTWSCSFVVTGLAADSWTELISVTAGSSNGSITITPIVDSGTPCSLSATTSGSRGTFDSSQPCSDPGGTYSGTLTLDGNSLTYSSSWTDAYGGGTEHADCTRR